MLTTHELDNFASATSIALVNNASEAAFTVNGSLSVLHWNSAAQELFGYMPQEVIGRSCASIVQAFNSDGQPLCIPNCDGSRCVQMAQPFNATACLVRNKEDSWVQVHIESVVLTQLTQEQTNDSVAAVVFLKSDKTESKEIEKQILQIFTFGRFGLAVGGDAVSADVWNRKQALTLLKLLLTRSGRAVHRDVLIEKLWPDADEHSGRERLKVTIYALRRSMRAAGLSGSILETVGKAYILRHEAIWMDATAFENFNAMGSTHLSQQKWEEAIISYTEAAQLYRGDYLEEDIHMDWFTKERERLRELYLEMLTNLARCHSELGDYAKAVSVCHNVLTDDPCRERIHSMIMEYMLHLGRTDAAVAQYHQCKLILARELGVEPCFEIEQLYKQIMS